ncbi:bifunctional 2-polyprenyl-6-hydroxyphenol methylase/3-demethylubiquinol 3-O-methyltransferase UbiG [Oceanicoccus sp. KOV_DT_Chl]|uniref:class I SAM-dependent methyltransferase n=1 Tax=Oceanicoccus sp. KOV_DT_Chl TaxID=1904639 RepID=UPI000C7AA576|nr:methyltransferase domain-containing protein [Oceanicoccus sp. KOV_DT_Chl]
MKTEFSNDQYDFAYPDGIENHWWSMARSKIISKVISKHLSPGALILEVGAGKGVTVKQLRSYDIFCDGVELAEVTPLKGVEDVMVTGLSAEELSQSEREKYEVILLLDVIEHLPDPHAFIKALRLSFPNVSTVLITVPAGPKIWSNYDQFYGHYRRYNLSMLAHLVESLGAISLVKSYFFHLPYLPARVLSIFKVSRSVRINAPHGLLVFLNKIIAKLMFFDFICMPACVAGTSAIVCFKFNKL